MLEPEQDLEQRLPVWDALQMLFMDTDVTLEYDRMVRTCAASAYTIAELEAVLFNEVLPALRFNMFLFPAPEWAGFEREWLKNRVLKKHRFGKHKPRLLQWYTHCHWRKLKPMIEQQRNS